jgi:hypothetical protein
VLGHMERMRREMDRIFDQAFAEFRSAPEFKEFFNQSEQKEKDGMVFSQKAHYSQLLTLPGPVQADKMVVERKENMLVVTLPKASSS